MRLMISRCVYSLVSALHFRIMKYSIVLGTLVAIASAAPGLAEKNVKTTRQYAINKPIVNAVRHFDHESTYRS